MGNPIANIIQGAIEGLTAPITNTIQKGIDKKMQAQEIAGEVQQQILGLKEKFIDSVNDMNAGQVEINKVEAQSQSLFKSGWRPWAGWGFGTLFMLMIITQLLHSYFPGQIREVPVSIFGIVAGVWSSLAGIRQVDKWIFKGKGIGK
jgi:hypothetical protein